MRIDETCNGPKPTVKVSLHSIPQGTIFRYGEHSCGPYLRVREGIVDLKENYSYPTSQFEGFTFMNYLELTKARLVLE